MSLLKLILNTNKSSKKAVQSFENNKKNITAVSTVLVLTAFSGVGVKFFNYFRTEHNEDESAELQRKTEENNRKIWLWSFASVAIEFLTDFVLR
jgi:hypothetical protein